MRTLWILVLALLLPLRLMASDAMAVHMIAGGATQQAKAVTALDDASIAMHADCAGHTDDATQDEAPAQNSHCPTCSHCQACSAVALALHAATPLMTLAASGPPSMRAKGFSSAELSPGHKPPIS